MAEARLWFSCRIAYAETLRAIALDVGISDPAVEDFRAEWQRFDVIDVEQDLVEAAARLSIQNRLRTLDALHLGSALVAAGPELVTATWDRRLWHAAKSNGLQVLPASPPE